MSSAERLVYFNGEFVVESEARISIYDSALMFGDMVFEMTRSFNGQQFKLREHVERLYRSTRKVQISLEMSPAEIEECCLQTVEVNKAHFREDDEHRLIINVSRGLLDIYKDVVGGHLGPNVIIADFPLRWTVRGMGRLFDEGIDAVIPSQRAIPAFLLDPKVKNRCRLHYLMANVQVSRYQGKNAWPLLLDPDGFIAESTGANVFLVRNGKLYTPEPRNVLRGISRGYVFELAEQLGFEVIETNFDEYDVLEGDEAFFTATPFCMLPVTKLNGQRIGQGTPGPVYRRFLDRWSEKVGVDIEAQIKRYNAEMEDSVEEFEATPYAFRVLDDS